MTTLVRRFGICLLAVALVSAGCQAPVVESGGDDGPTAIPSTTPEPGGGEPAANNSGEGTANDTATDAPNVTVLNGSLRVDPGQVFQRVQRLQGTDVPAPTQVRVFDTEGEFRNSTGGGELEEIPTFWRLAGLETGSIDSSELEIRKNGYVAATGEVGIYLGANATLAEERMLLAHEFTHYVQTQNTRRNDIGPVTGVRTTESSLLRRAIVEGAAVYTADAYMREYGDGDVLNSEWYPRIQDSYPDGHVGRLLNSQYIFGSSYVDGQLSSPEELPAVYENPPTTSEQLVHGLDPEGEPATPLSVETETGEGWRASGSDQFGELFVRYALESDVGQERAARAAAGWGNDTLTFFRPTDGGVTGYVWVLDWDDPANDTEFREALTDALDARGTERGGVWTLTDANTTASVVGVSDETTALVVGPERFVTGTTLTADGTTVRVSVESTQTESERVADGQ